MAHLTHFADFACPFSYCLDSGLFPQLETSETLTIRWRPYELRPDAPAGGVPLKPADAGRIWGGYRRLCAEWDVPIARKAPRAWPNTRYALCGAEAASHLGVLDRYRRDAFDAYWVQGRDLSDLEVVRALLPEADVTEPRWAEALERTRTDAHAENVEAIPALVGPNGVLFGLREREEVLRLAGVEARATS